MIVALHPEGVDRNVCFLFGYDIANLSPSTRRAWIEMPLTMPLPRRCASPSTRRAWIEIGCY